MTHHQIVAKVHAYHRELDPNRSAKDVAEVESK